MDELNNQNMLQVGTILHGTYKIESYLASGGFGNTYLAKNIEFDETYAIKEFFVKGVCQRDGNSTTISVSNSENADSFAQQKEKFKKEARRLRSLNNPHIVKVYDLFEENGTAYYVMDYVDGENLSTRLKRTNASLAESEVRNYLNQILDGLEAIHNEGMFHLDIKPANIMVDSHNVVKLIDFGASKQQSTVGGATMSTGISYTNGYAPSEQMAQSYDKFGPWTDFYALGATMYKLLTNQDPPSVSDLSEDETEDKHLALPMPNVSGEMKKLVVWMMQVNRLKRPKKVGEIRRILQQSSAATSNNEETKAFSPHQSYVNPVNDDEETVWADKAEKVETEVNELEKCNEKEQTNSSNSHIYYLKVMAWFVIALLVTLAILFLPQSARTAANTNVASTDSDSAYFVGEATADSDGVYYVENKEEVFFNQTVKYTGTVLINPDPGRFYPCDDNGELIFSDGRKYKGPFNRGRMEGDNATFIYPNGDIYTGSFYDNHFSKGTYTVKTTGEQFIGSFDSNGQPKKGAWYDKKGNFLQNV